MAKNLFLQTPSAGDIEDLFTEGANDISRLSLPSFPGAPATSTTPAPQQTAAPAAPDTAAPAPAAPAAPGRAAPTRDDLIRRAQQLGIDPKLALEIHGLESSSNWNSKDSNKGAVGGMQVMPDTYKMMMGTYAGQRDPWNNMEAGLRYIAYGMKKLGTSDPALLAAGYQSGYDRASLKRGEIPNTTDGGMTTRAYAARIASRVGTGGGTGNSALDLQSRLDAQEPGRYKVLDSTEASRLDLQSQLDQEEPGRFKVLTQQELDKLPASAFTDLAKDETPKDASLWGDVTDVAKNLKVGFNMAAQDVRELTSRVPVVGKPFVRAMDAVDRWTHPQNTGDLITGKAPIKDSDDLLKRDTAAVVAGMTPQMRGALEKKWWDDEKGTFGPAWKDWRSYAGGLLQSLPEQAVTMAPGMVLAKAAYLAKVGQVGVQAASAAAARTAMISGMLAEGSLGGAQSAREVRDQINELKPEVLASSEAFQQLKAQGMTDEQARTALADDMSTRAFVTAGVATGLFGGMGDRALAKIVTEKVSKSTLKRAFSGAARSAVAEGVLEELPQSALQQVAQNEAVQHADKNVSLGRDVANQALGGLAIGGLQGGGMGAVGGARNLNRGGVPGGDPVAEAAPQPAAPAPAAPTGPIGRAMERAAGAAPEQQAAQPAAPAAERVVVGDDGQQYRLTTGEDGVTFEPIAEEAAAPDAQQPAATAPAAEAAPAPAEERAPTVKEAMDGMGGGIVDALYDHLWQRVEAGKTNEQDGWAPSPVLQAAKVLRNQGVELTRETFPDFARKLDNAIEGKKGAEYQAAIRGVMAEYAPKNAAPAPAAPETKPETKAAAPSAPAPKAAERPMTDWSETELRDRLRYLTKQAKTNGGWNKMLTAERAKVSREIDRRNEGAPAPAEPVTAAPIEQPAEEAPPTTASGAYLDRGDANRAAISAAEREGRVFTVVPREEDGRTVFDIKPQEAANAGTDAGANRAGADAQARASVQSEPEPAAAQPGSASASAEPAAGAVTAGEQSAPVKDAYAGKWFGSREKAQAFLDKKKAGATHEIVQTGKVRFEIKPKVAEGMERFPAESGTLGIPRDQMPQVPTQSHGGLVNHLNAQGIEHETKMVPAADLKPTQAEFSPGKVAQAKEATGDRAVIVSNDGHIIDGHHQALAAAEEGKDVKAIVLDAPVDQALEAVKNSPSAQQAADDAAGRWSRATDTERTAFLARAGYVNDGKLNLAGRRLLRTPLDQMRPSTRGKIESAMQIGAAPAEANAPRAATPGADTIGRMNAVVRAKSVSELDEIARAEEAAWNATEKPAASHEAAHAELMRRIERKRETLQEAEPAAERDNSSAAKQAAARDFVRAARENGAKKIADIMPGIKDGRTFQTGAPFVKPGFIMVDGPKGEQFRLADLWKATEPAPRAEAANDAAPTEPTPPTGTDRFAGNKLFTSDKVEAARARLRSKLSGAQLNSGIDPEVVMDGMTIAGAYIEAGVRDFAAYAKAMTDDLGDAVKPYLLSFWEAARNYPGLETEGMTSVQESKRLHDELIASQSASSTMQSKEVAQNDGNATAGAADESSPEQGAGRVSPDEGGRDAGRVPEQPSGDDAGGDQRGAAKRDRQSRDAGKPAVRGATPETDAGDQHGREVGRGDRAGAGDGNDRGAVSRVGDDYRVKPGELKRTGSWRSTAEQNVRIVELVKQLEQEGRRPTPDEAALLTKFTGWGASEIANGIFPDRYGRYKDAAWQALGERLKAALTPEQYEQAKRTTQYAHYTSEGVIRSIYDGMRRLGFAGGKVLEPGMGIGLFKGLMPESMAATSQYTGVEYDPLTGAIAKLLYPQSNIIVGDFTKTAMPREFFDAAIGNPPFASVVVTNDPEYKKQGFMLHDYFFAKTIDRVKPGGMLVFVTSKGTMDKASDRARKYLADRANLIGAVRLPQTAFKDNAGTEVVTDVLFLQKRGPGVADNGVKWLGTAEVQTPQGPAQINEYFAAHPEMVLGAHALTGSMYRANEYTVVPEPGVDMDAAFAKAIANLPEGVYQPGAQNPAASKAVALERDFNPTHKKEGGLYVGDNGTLMQVDSGTGVELTHRRGADGKQIALKPADKAFLKSWVGLRDALKQAQLDQLSDGAWEQSLKALSDAYDGFVAKHGNLLAYSTIERTADDGTVTVTKRFKNDPLLRLDVDGALAYSLEHIKENGEIVKAPVLSERVLQRPREPEIKTTHDAMFVSLNNKGSLDLDDVARLSNMSRQEVIDALGTAIYEDPAKGWQTSDAYLSGNVVRKLAEAQAAARSDRKYQRNVEALLAVQPKPLGPSDITVKLGQNWIPAADVAVFASEALNENIDVTYNSRLGNWSAEQTSSNYSEFNTPKMNAGQILDAVLNNRQIKVTFRDDQGKTHVDAEATEKANDVAQKMRAAFARWIWTDTKRADRLVNYYNENFNNIAPRQFDGSHLTLPGVSLRFDLRENQKRAIWRGIQEGDMYLAHAVGAGKTFTMIATGMEERRLGLSNKPMYAVPNHMLAQFAREFLELYPAANIMVADEQNFHTHNRRRFVAQAALNNPDAIIITHSAFGRIGMSDEYASAFIRDQIDEWKAALDETDKGDRITRKQIERRIEQLERRLEAKQGGEKKDKVLSFEELGVDRLFVDEFHEFRKLDFATQQSNIKGIDPAGSQRAMDLFMKVQYLRSKKPGRALVAASGTPVTNTMGELYTAQRFFQPEQLAEDGLDTFDAWANQYGDIVAGFEQNAAGGYEVVSRFAKFQNVPELMRRVRSFMDILTSQQLSQYVDRPAIEGGGRQIMVTPEPFGYKAYQKALEQRITAIRNRKGPPQKGQDIILNVIADGRFSAIDMRFVDPTAPSDPSSKLNQMIDAVIADYHAASDFEYSTNGKVDPIKGASHIIFTDIGLGEQSAKNRGFDMKAWIEKRLVDGGIPREQIAFMRDNKEHAKKERLFADMREGKKRVLIGGKDMETGVNVQKRLYTEEHLDAPWFPASVEQREGRIIRQGNQNKQVRIRAWATKGSYDSTMWGMNARKARFIEQALNGDDSVRSLEDVSEASAFDMAAALASGDERYMKLAGLKADVERLERLSYAHHDDQNKLRRDKHWAETQIERDNTLAGEIKAALEKRTPIRAGEFAGMVGKTSYDKRDEFSNAIFNRFKELAGKEADTAEQIGEIGGFPIMFHGTQLKGSGEYIAAVSVDIPGDPSPLVQLPLDPDLPVGGIATRAANQVNNLDNQLAQLTARVQQNERRVEQIGNRLGAPFPEQAELLDKMAQLNALEIELTAEKAAENAPAPSSDAAAATLEVEGEKPADEAPKFSVAEGADRNQVVPVTQIDTFDVSLDDLWRTANEWYRDNLTDHPVQNESLGAQVQFSKNGRSKVLSVGRRDPRRMSIVKALADIARNGVLVNEEGDKKERTGIAGYATLVAPVEVDGTLYAVSMKVRQEDRARNARSIFYTVEAFNLEKVGASRANTAQQGQDHPSTGSRQEIGSAGNDAAQRAPASAPALSQGNGVTLGDLVDAINEANRAFSVTASTAADRSNVIMGDANANGNVFSSTDLANTVKSGPLGDTVSQLIAQHRVVLHDTAATLPVKDAPAGVRGVTMPDGSIHLVAANLTPETALPVLLHEAFHQGGEKLIGTAAWTDLMGRLDSLHRQARQSSGRAREFFDAARARVASAQRAGAMPETLTAEEFGAYTIENYEQAPAAFRKWVDDVIGTVKAWLLRRFGKQLGAVTPAQLRAIAAAALRDQTGGPTDGARFSVGAPQPGQPNAGLTPPAPSRFERLQAAVQDNMNRVKKVQERIKELTGVKELGTADYYRAEANRPGRIAARLEDAKKQLTGPLMERLAKSGHTPEQLEELLHAEHAQERNERVALINEDMPDGGSGMTTADANAILAKYAGNTELQALAQQARDIAKATLDLKLAYGLIDQQTYDTLTNGYKNYVPLKGDGEYGPKVKRAMGHEERDEHILQNIARDYDQAVVVGEKNLARQSLLALVAQNDDPDLWTIGVPPRGRYVAGRVYNVVDGNGQTIGSFISRSQVNAFLEGAGPQAATYQVLDSNGDRVAEFVKPLQDNEVMVYVKGEPVRIQIKDEALARQLRPLDQRQMHPILEMMRGVNRYLSKIYTGYNPAFILRNAARDALTGTINMVGHEGAAVAAKAWAKYPVAVKALGQWAATGKEPAGEIGKLLKEYRMHGGKTGASWMSDLEEQGKSLTRMYEDAYGASGYLKDGRKLKAATVAGRKIVSGMAHVVEIANQATENALRLSLYMTLRDQGVTPGRAAQAAKNVTVDFDRKGTLTPALGAVYLFFNPAVQGTANAMRTLASGEHRGQALVALGMLATLGFFAGASGMDDDKDRWLGESWDTRTRNFIFGIGNHTLRVPLSQEFAPVYAFGVAMAEAMRGESAMKSAVRIVSSFIDAYFPLHGAYNPDSDNHTLDGFLSAVPTVIKPLAETAANRNSFGSQIVPDTQSTKPLPDNLKMYRATKGTVYDALAQQIAAAGELAGARRYENDLSKVSPETLKYIWRTYAGGLGQFVTDSIGAAGMAATSAGSMTSNDVPIVKDFWKQNDVKPLRGRYYDLAREAKEAAEEFRVAKKAGDGEALDDIFARPEQGELVSLDRMTQRYGKAIAALRDEQVMVNVDKTLTTEQKRARLKELEAEEETLYRGAIEAFRR
ncbi:multidomain (soluble lytic transglycosylase/helicase/methylase) protein [Burkholderia phage DC1]|uniref:Multidomain (Soluble lytic transglycosylase/helicase/methylase) protein n=1 Tax=Burkholderia phage DC1 TaxID=2881398 RepID=I6NW45_9CAUD|nr:DarB-like antirestriction [Burkholderia phage DC1]AEZ50893.1 multidomain (soluble lytic transglycosylase/helicase/methylase) protein [Burkholderia phage DC1]